MKICPNCGKQKKYFVENVCEECYKKPLVSRIQDIELFKCMSCEKYNIGHKQEMEFDIMPFLEFDKNARIDDVHHEFKDKKIIIIVTGTYGKNIFSEEYVLPFKMNGITCKQCSKKGTKYFEGTLQLRTSNENVLKEARKYVERALSEYEKKGVFCNKIVPIEKGIDYIITSKRAVIELANNIYTEYGMRISINEQLFSHDKQKSKDLFRVNANVFLPDFVTGDILDIDGSIIRVNSVHTKFLSGYDLDREKQVKLEIGSKQFHIIATQKDYSTVEVMQDKPTIKVLNPETYQPIEVKTSKKFKRGEKIKVLFFKDKAWCFD